MTKKIVLALALTLSAASFAAPPAYACGGYGSVDPITAGIQRAAGRWYMEHVSAHDSGYDVYAIDLRTERRAVARLQYRDGERVVHRLLTLRLRDGQWRVVRAA